MLLQGTLVDIQRILEVEEVEEGGVLEVIMEEATRNLLIDQILIAHHQEEEDGLVEVVVMTQVMMMWSLQY